MLSWFPAKGVQRHYFCMQRGCFCMQRDCICELWGEGEGFLAMVEDVEVMPEVVEVMPEAPFLTSQPHFGGLKPHGYWDEASEGKVV